MVWQSGLLVFTALEDPSLCAGPSILSGEGPTANPSESHHLTESVLELQQVMELLNTFTDKEVLKDALPSNWVKITSSRLAEPIQ